MDECRPLGGGRRGVLLRASVLRLTVRGRTVQVGPIKPTLKAPRTERLKLKYDDPLSKFAFKFNLRRYIVGEMALMRVRAPQQGQRHGLTLMHCSAQPEPLLSLTE